MDSYVGEIRIFSGNFAPQDWHICDGSLVKISDYQVLYAVVGTTWGGDGVNTFGLPDLRGRLPIGKGQGTGLTNRVVGQKGGTETVTLTANELPTHTHALNAANSNATTSTLSSTVVLAKPLNGDVLYASNITGGTAQQFGANAVSTNPGGQPHNNVMPSMALNFIICLNGLYPTAN